MRGSLTELLRRGRARERGQILVIVGVGMLAFLGFAALVTDIGIVYAAQRYERNLADSAALAGAQSLQIPGTRKVTAAEYANARHVAMQNIMNEVANGDPAPSCAVGGVPPYPFDVIDCPIPGTGYRVSIQTPAPLCVTCDKDHAILVGLTRTDVPATFARIFGRDSWTVRQTSVAGIWFNGKYAVITLRPPHPSNPNQNDPNVQIGGGTQLVIPKGDIGTNTNAVYTSTGSGAVLGEDYYIRHYDKPKAWVGAPEGKPSNQLIQDPNFTYPVKTGGTTWISNTTPIGGVLPRTDANDPDCDRELSYVSGAYTVGGIPVKDYPKSKIFCYKPGIYSYKVTIGNGEVGLLTPGVYFFDRGLVVNEVVLGGYRPNSPGVALHFPRLCVPTCGFDARNGDLVALNGGDKYNNPAGREALPAVGYDGVTTMTSGPPLNFTITIFVQRDDACVVQPTDPPLCNANQNQAISLFGGSGLYLAGIQYGPSDNMAIGGSSGSIGKVGQIIAWTVKYSGGVTVTQDFPALDDNGIVRLDAACSGSGANSMTNPLCTP